MYVSIFIVIEEHAVVWYPSFFLQQREDIEVACHMLWTSRYEMLQCISHQPVSLGNVSSPSVLSCDQSHLMLVSAAD